MDRDERENIMIEQLTTIDTNDYTQEDSFLIEIRNELYGRNWGDMESELEQRKAEKPYIYRLVQRIDADLDRIRRLKSLQEQDLDGIRGAHPVKN